MLFNCDAFDFLAVSNLYDLKVVESRTSVYLFYLNGLCSLVTNNLQYVYFLSKWVSDQI